MNSRIRITTICSILLLFPFYENCCFSQEFLSVKELDYHRARNYYIQNKSKMHRSAQDNCIYGWYEDWENEHTLTIRTNTYDFINTDFSAGLYNLLYSISADKVFTACFVPSPFSGGIYMYVFEQFFGKPLAFTEGGMLNSPSLYGVMTNGEITIYLQGSCPDILAKKEKMYYKQYRVLNWHHMYNTANGWILQLQHVFFINQDSFYYIDSDGYYPYE